MRIFAVNVTDWSTITDFASYEEAKEYNDKYYDEDMQILYQEDEDMPYHVLMFE